MRELQTLHREKLVGLLFPHEVHLADIAFTEKLDLLKAGWGYFDLLLSSSTHQVT